MSWTQPRVGAGREISQDGAKLAWGRGQTVEAMKVFSFSVSSSLTGSVSISLALPCHCHSSDSNGSLSRRCHCLLPCPFSGLLPTCSVKWERLGRSFVLLHILRAKGSERLGSLPKVTRSWAIPSRLCFPVQNVLPHVIMEPPMSLSQVFLHSGWNLYLIFFCILLIRL